MSSIVRTLVTGIALVACFGTALADTAFPSAADRAFATRLFAPIVPGLAKSVVPVMVPGALPAADLDGLRAELISSGPDGYSIDLDYTPDCHGATACYLGHISGIKSPGDGKALHGTRVPMDYLGTTGFFVQGQCGASCSDSTITFEVYGFLYVFAEKGATLETLSQWVSSMGRPLKEHYKDQQ
jgi:hypothetical protein